MREERRGEKKESVEKLKKHVIFYAKQSEIKNVYFSDMPMILFIWNKSYFNSDNFSHCIPSICVFFYYRILRTSFLMRFLVGCHLLWEVSTKLIL